MIRRMEYLVVVTGAAPFKENKENPVAEVKLKVSDTIKRSGRTPIKIIKYPFDFRNVLKDEDRVAALWNQEKSVYDPDCEKGEKIYIDAILHLGMSGVEVWQVEKQARRDGYEWTGDDGIPIPKHNGGKGGRFEGCPEILKPMFDVDGIRKQVKKDLPNIPIETSTDAGLKYCELTFYTSLATLYKREEDARVQYLHHPGKKTSDEDIEQGARVAESVICALIDQIEEKGSKSVS